MKRIIRFIVLGLLGILAVTYGADYVAAKYRIPGNRQIFQDIRVDQLYTATNKWHEVEWSRGEPVLERCVNALFPHFGYRPCWYVTRHTTQITNAD
ncbi:MAG TPA: hypothetical protein VHB50_00010 [Bryobacteraceae bacterium]|nr:hypothetical protein [Bryobacteraceae bacterium]